MHGDQLWSQFDASESTSSGFEVIGRGHIVPDAPEACAAPLAVSHDSDGAVFRLEIGYAKAVQRLCEGYAHVRKG